MKILSFILLLALTANLYAQDQKQENAALVLIDIQNFYFKEGKMELVNPIPASKNASIILNRFRDDNMLVVHIRHNFEPGGEIHDNVKPIEGEKVFSKDEVNAFNGTQLKAFLDENKIDQLVLVGMQTHMCLEGTTRAAYDLGFNCVIIGDACATKDLIYDDEIVRAEDVHHSTLKTLESYADVITTQEFLTKKSKLKF